MNDDLNPAASADLAPEERAVADLLGTRQPVPAPVFRGKLARRIATLDGGYGPRPAHLWATAAGFGAAGALLVIIGAIVASII